MAKNENFEKQTMEKIYGLYLNMINCIDAISNNFCYEESLSSFATAKEEAMALSVCKIHNGDEKKAFKELPVYYKCVLYEYVFRELEDAGEEEEEMIDLLKDVIEIPLGKLPVAFAKYVESLRIKYKV